MWFTKIRGTLKLGKKIKEFNGGNLNGNAEELIPRNGDC